jgi:hypothetical protein
MKKITALTALAVALIVAFVVAPATLAANSSTTDLTGPARLSAAFRTAFVGYWRSGDGVFDPRLQRVVDYWFRYHIAKAVLAAALLVVFIALGLLLWRAFLRTRGPRATALAAGGVLTTALAVLSLVTVMANIHGMAAPFGSLLPMLFGHAGAPLAGTLTQIQRQLAGHQNSPALEPIVSDYVKFHAVMAVEGSIVVIALIALTVPLWRKFTSTDRAERRTRRLLAAYGVFVPLFSVALAVVVVANAATAAHPMPGLEGFFAGGW